MRLTRRGALAAAAALAAGGCATTSPQHADPFSIEAMTAVLERLDRGGALRTGEPSELALAAWKADRLEALGFRVERQPVEAPGFNLRRAAVAWAGGETTVIPQSIVSPTGPMGVSGPLRLVEANGPAPALGGAIAVVMLPRARHSRLGAPAIAGPLRAAAEAGARAVVLVTDGPTGGTIWLNADYRTPPPVPVAVVGPVPGGELLAAARRGVDGRLIIDAETMTRRSYNLIGRIEGRGRPVVVSTPRTGWTRAVAERGPGLAVWLALAAWAPAALPRNDLVFLSTTAHEYDNAGGLAFIETLAPKPEATALWAHLGAGFASPDAEEGPGYSIRRKPTADPQRRLMGSDAIAPILAQAFAGQPGLEAVGLASQGGAAGELQEILAHGYAPAFGLFGAHRHHHVDSDRIDQLDPALVRAVAVAVRDSIQSILGAPA
jgi:hypothetical protein